MRKRIPYEAAAAAAGMAFMVQGSRDGDMTLMNDPWSVLPPSVRYEKPEPTQYDAERIARAEEKRQRKAQKRKEAA